MDYIDQLQSQKKAQRKAELLEKIMAVRGKIQKTNQLIHDFNLSKGNLLSITDQLDSQKSLYDLTADNTFQTDIFEGLAAQQLQEVMEGPMENLRFTIEYIITIQGQINNQITRLEEYIKKQEEKIKSYQEELDSL